MKKMLVLGCGIILFFSCLLEAQVLKNVSTQLGLNTIEALALGEESGDGCWLQEETVSCKLDEGNGMFTASVQRICVLCYSPSSCRSVKCGEPF